MPLATDPAFAAAATRYARGQISTANTNRDGTGTGPATAILTGVANGTKIEEIIIQAQVTTTAGMVRIYIYDGSAARLIDEVVVSAITVGAAVPAFRASRIYTNLWLPSASHSITASTHNAETFNVHVFGGDF